MMNPFLKSENVSKNKLNQIFVPKIKNQIKKITEFCRFNLFIFSFHIFQPVADEVGKILKQMIDISVAMLKLDNMNVGYFLYEVFNHERTFYAETAMLDDVRK